MTDTYDRLEAAIQDWIREDGDDSQILTDWSLSAASIDMRTSGDRVQYRVGGSGAPHAVLGLARIATRHAQRAIEGDDE